MDKIGFLDLKEQNASVKKEIFEVFEKVFEKTAFSSGPFVEEFEQNFAKYTGAKYCVALSNGTAAVHMMCLVAGIKQDDEVIIPANTFIASPWGVVYEKAKPVFVDCDPDTWEIDPSKIEAAITPKTKAIMGVHLYGQPFNREAVKEISDKHNLILLEDAAQSHGAKYNNEPIGKGAYLQSYSFYPGKNLGATGEGGAVVTNDEKLYKKMLSLRNHGSTEKYYHEEIGYNYRMGGLEGAALNIKLKYIDQWNNKRREIAKRYLSEITNPKIKMQWQPGFSDSVFHLFVITTEDRAALTKHLNDNNIFPGMHYPLPCHLQQAFGYLNYKVGDFPNSEYLAEHCLSLPMYAELPEKSVDRIIAALNSF